MRKSDKLIGIAILVIVMSLISNILYVKVTEIDGVIFFDHYYDVGLENSPYAAVQLDYVINRSDDREIIMLVFEDESVQIKTQSTQDRNFGQYKVVTLFGELSGEIAPNQQITVEKGKAVFNNGDEQDVDFGKIAINTYKRNEMVQMRSSSSSNDHSSTVIYKIKEPIVIENLVTAFEDELNHLFDIAIEIDDQDYYNPAYLEHGTYAVNSEHQNNYVMLSDVEFPLTAEKNMKIYSRYINSEPLLAYYDLSMFLKTGDTYVQSYNIRYNPLIGYKNVRALIEKGVKND